MAIRTLQFQGMGFGASPATITVTANGQQIYNGTVPTVNQPLPVLPNPALIADQVTLFNLEIDTAFSGQIPMTCAVNNGTVIFGDVLANYIYVYNPVYSAEQIAILINPATTTSQKIPIWSQVANPPFSAEELATLENPSTTTATVGQIVAAHGCRLLIGGGSTQYGIIDSNDARSNVAIDGVTQSPDRGDLTGTWWWSVANGSTLSYNLEVDAAAV
jgi:hypothetical protein